tara:strand:- start:8 stop:2890 length:2883 start_codon:yes stop_codon:yes gene_type:complete
MSIPGSASPLFFTAAVDAAAAGPIKSVRFNSGDSAYLNRTPSSAGSNTTWTLSTWVKKTGNDNHIFGAGAGNTPGRFGFGFNGSDKIFAFIIASNSTVFSITTDAVFRDPSAWYHLVLIADTGNSTQADRFKIYVNGVLQSVSGTLMPSSQNTFVNTTAAHTFGRRSYTASDYFNGYLASTILVDGTAKDETDFGAFDDNGIWQAAAYSGSFGTNGFHLFDFANESGIGNDSSGNDNDFTVNNLTSEGGSKIRTTELSVNHASGVISLPGNAFDSTYISARINTSTFAVTNTAWLGSYANGYAEARWIPVGGYAVTSSLRVYFGVYSNAAASSTLTVTYTDTTTESSSQFTSGNNNWMTLFTASNAAGKTIQKIEISNPSATNVQFGGFVVDDQIVETSNIDTDVLFDVPTNGTQSDTGAGGEVSGNYCTFNPLNELTGGYNFALSDGNLEATNGGDAPGTMAFGSGKKYFELTVKSASSFSQGYYGIVNIADHIRPRAWATSQIAALRDSGSLYGDGSTGSAPAATQVGDVYGFAVDVDNQKLFISVNGTYLNSADPASGTGASFTGRDFSNYAPLASIVAGNSQTIVLNAGQRPFNTAAPSGFQAHCTTNLSTPTIADGSDYFDAVLYSGSGSGSGSQTISGLSFSPDFTWLKSRSSALHHRLFDTVQGPSSALSSNLNGSSDDLSSIFSFTNDGFTVTDDSNVAYNRSGRTYVGWNWDAGSSTASNTDGDVTSSVRANQTAGFSIVKWTAPTWNGGPQSVGHGLNAAPSFIMAKVINDSGSWYCYHKSLDASNPQDKYISLNDSSAVATLADSWGTSAPSSTTFGDRQLGWSDGKNVIAFCMSPVSGYSAFGSYIGNASTDGPFVYTGFRVKWLMARSVGTTANWLITDAARSPNNVVDKLIAANTSSAEDTYTQVDFLSNGFKIKNTAPFMNASGYQHIYIAFAQNPFQANGGLAR